MFVYILQNGEKGNFYIGSTANWDRRLKEHKRGKVRTTKSWDNVRVALVQEYPDIQTAQKIEVRLKRFKNRAIIEKIVRDKKIKIS